MIEISKKIEGSIFIISIKGNLILSVLDKTRKFIKECIDEENAREIILDMSEVSFIDSAGVGFIVAIFKSLKTRNGKFVLCGINDKPKNVFKLTRIDKIISIYNDVETAKQAI